MERLFDGGPADPVIVWEALPAAIAFLATLMPFFHGSMRHMHSEWGHGANPSVRVMLYDFTVLFGQTILFFIMAEYLRNPYKMAWALWVLLVMDVIWLWTRRGRSGLRLSRREGLPPWIRVNAPFLVLLPAVILGLGARGPNTWIVGAVVCAIALARTTWTTPGARSSTSDSRYRGQPDADATLDCVSASQIVDAFAAEPVAHQVIPLVRLIGNGSDRVEQLALVQVVPEQRVGDLQVRQSAVPWP